MLKTKACEGAEGFGRLMCAIASSGTYDLLFDWRTYQFTHDASRLVPQFLV
ncbi:hypothetical protein sync_2580 [Synechococcus sp. CC9311]|nr:hypothetical protein sync_2580 [Synechococcus sp. CC9311]